MGLSLVQDSSGLVCAVGLLSSVINMCAEAVVTISTNFHQYLPTTFEG